MNSLQSPNFRIVTLNCWGVPFAARDRSARMQAIGQTLSQMNLDLIGLQEVYLPEDRNVISEQVAVQGLVYNHYFPSGVFGSGLFIMSRYPFVAYDFWRYSLNGEPDDLIRSDYYAGKGLAWVRVQTPQGLIDFYNTHLIAPYDEIGDDIYYSHRVTQAYELTRHVKETSQDTPAIVTGDLNSPSSSLTYRTIREYGMLMDSYLVAMPGDPGITVTTEIPYLLVHEPERIDYILYRNSKDRLFQVRESKVVFRDLPQEFKASMRAYSDHYGVLSSFDLKAETETVPTELQQLVHDGELQSTFHQGVQQSTRAEQTSGLTAGAGVLFTLLLILLWKNKIMTRYQFLRIIVAGIICLMVAFIGLKIFTVSQIASQVKSLEEILGEMEP